MIMKIMFMVSAYAKLVTNQNYMCVNDIWCDGTMLHLIQTSGLYQDSKTFVDMKLTTSPSDVRRAFTDMMARTTSAPSKDDIKDFVESYFTLDDLKPWTPPDFNPNPTFLRKITNKSVGKFATYLVSVWPQLGRKLDEDVIKHSDRYSYIPMPHGMIVPGGRFRECYYWDTYWVINGLLICEMYRTVRGILGNFIYMVRRWGYVPNGNRIYYLSKSQPPLLVPMVYNYYKFTHDKKFIRQSVDYLENELQFWLKRRFVRVKKANKTFMMFHYDVETSSPRPESYREDIEIAQYMPDKKVFYGHIQSATESGWDFSSRWCFDEDGNISDDLATIETNRIVPVDLNSFLYLSFKCLSELYGVTGNRQKRRLWKQKSVEIKEAINEVLWHEDDSMWYDYDIKLKRLRRYFFASNLTPLWVRAYNKDRSYYYGKMAVNYMKRHEVYNEFAGGIPVSMRKSHQQWDFPNAWPPLQAIVIQGLDRTGNMEAINYAERLAKKWISLNMKGQRDSGLMYEKYDAMHVGQNGSGGEYESQSGFGWTNGVVLEFIYRYYVNDQRGKDDDEEDEKMFYTFRK